QISVLCEGADVRVYDWHELRFVRDVQGYRLDTVTVGNVEQRILRAAGGEPLGYLVAPETARQAIFRDHRWSENGYALDWLDFTGGVEGWFGATNGLAGDAAKRWPGARVPGAGSFGASVGSGYFSRPSGGAKFANSWDGQWVHGTEFIVGPLLLRIS